MTAGRPPLADRVRATLAAEQASREVRMFGGVSFMVNDKLIVAVRGDGDLLVRADPALAAHPGAGPAEMGAGRAMGPEWIRVAAEAVATAKRLSFWIGAALEHNGRRAGSGTR